MGFKIIFWPKSTIFWEHFTWGSFCNQLRPETRRTTHQYRRRNVWTWILDKKKVENPLPVMRKGGLSKSTISTFDIKTVYRGTLTSGCHFYYSFPFMTSFWSSNCEKMTSSTIKNSKKGRKRPIWPSFMIITSKIGIFNPWETCWAIFTSKEGLKFDYREKKVKNPLPVIGKGSFS